jgi:hypothetical protein
VVAATVAHVPTLVVDHDASPESRRHVRRLLADGTLRDAGHTTELGEVERKLRTGDAAAALVLPAGLARALSAQRPAEVQVTLYPGRGDRIFLCQVCRAAAFAACGSRERRLYRLRTCVLDYRLVLAAASAAWEPLSALSLGSCAPSGIRRGASTNSPRRRSCSATEDPLSYSYAASMGGSMGGLLSQHPGNRV